jgi:hypothetical protein
MKIIKSQQVKKRASDLKTNPNTVPEYQGQWDMFVEDSDSEKDIIENWFRKNKIKKKEVESKPEISL